MAVVTQTADAEGRVTLPPSFANVKVIVEQISETEIRVRKVEGRDEGDVSFAEESRPRLSQRDRDLFLELLDNPPPPNDALKNLFQQR